MTPESWGQKMIERIHFRLGILQSLVCTLISCKSVALLPPSTKRCFYDEIESCTDLWGWGQEFTRQFKVISNYKSISTWCVLPPDLRSQYIRFFGQVYSVWVCLLINLVSCVLVFSLHVCLCTNGFSVLDASYTLWLELQRCSSNGVLKIHTQTHRKSTKYSYSLNHLSSPCSWDFFF